MNTDTTIYPLPSVTIVIVNWNSGEHLAKCLRHLALQTLPPDRILIVDNASSDQSIDAIEVLYNLSILTIDTNLGFAGGNNRALAEIDTDYVALLNPDAFPESDWLSELVKTALAYPEVASFGSLQLAYGDNDLLDGVGDVYHFSGLVWRHGHGQVCGEGDMVAGEIFSSCAGAALYQRHAMEEVGGFDEDFFCYVEDMDLGFRLRLAGYGVMSVPGAVVHHVGSASTGGQHSDFAVYHGHRNLEWAYIKNMPSWLFWACLPLHLLMNLATIFVFVLRGKGMIIFRAKRDALLGLPKMWRKRRAIQGRRTVSVGEIWRVLDKRLSFSRCNR